MKDYDEICKTYNSDKCQKLYKEGVAGFPACKELGEVLSFQNQVIIDKADYLFQRYCSKDENDKYCPLSEYDFEEKESKEEFDNAINQTCKSRKCIDTAIEYFNKEINLENKVNEFQSKIKNSNMKRQFNSNDLKSEEKKEAIINFLESDYCSSQSPKKEIVKGNSREISENDAISLNYSGIFFITIALHLYYLI
jgi:FKBP-type peptidyl-prolyl cis-trans isomerase